MFVRICVETIEAPRSLVSPPSSTPIASPPPSSQPSLLSLSLIALFPSSLPLTRQGASLAAVRGFETRMDQILKEAVRGSDV